MKHNLNTAFVEELEYINSNQFKGIVFVNNKYVGFTYDMKQDIANFINKAHLTAEENQVASRLIKKASKQFFAHQGEWDYEIKGVTIYSINEIPLTKKQEMIAHQNESEYVQYVGQMYIHETKDIVNYNWIIGRYNGSKGPYQTVFIGTDDDKYGYSFETNQLWLGDCNLIYELEKQNTTLGKPVPEYWYGHIKVNNVISSDLGKEER